MKQSLKQKLFNLIKEKGIISYGQMCQYVAEEGFKISTAERRLRELMHGESPMIEPVMKKSRRNTDYISSYSFKGFIKKEPIYTLDINGQRHFVGYR